MNKDWQTHQVTNQYTELSNYNLFTTDTVLREYFESKQADWASEELSYTGADIGTEEAYHKATLANQFTPILKAFDNRGNRQDVVEFHPAWHWFMKYAKGTGMISLPFENKQPHRWAYFGASFMLMSQIEAGSMCPTTMTQGAIPLIAREPALWEKLSKKLLSHSYDERDVPIAEKKSLWIGMGMTEKQGGSDVRSNTTTATPVGKSGRGEAYLLRGHKWFYSAPMCDAHLVIARTSDSDALGCFFVPRWKFDGTKNEIHIQRLKDKVGNKSNSSSEVEFKDAWGILMGDEGRGIPTIIEMANYTRLACVLGSTGIIRQATVQAIAYTRKREAFGKKLYHQPLMRNVLADFALESEAAQHLSLKLCEAFEAKEDDQLAKAWKRLVTPAAKYWVCKRAESLTAEAMEVFGGNGYVEEGIMSRLFREAPVNSIWEGSGNVMCLDVLRAVGKEPDLVKTLMGELSKLAAGDQAILVALDALTKLFQTDPSKLEALARTLTEKLILIVQACLMKDRAPQFMSDAFIATRIVQAPAINYGAFITNEIAYNQILERAFPPEGDPFFQE
ncbi:acyl-CoA dehydrogenase family protein [Marivirga atlantica]|jgi:putative acyl-CoA dehydrogenase|uniref:Acyl-CoA dehydrogenase family protein n=1 Tax=Marivirga atlantica TaxID=1548457 RepID=A0A937DJK9_9BACT|nr:acyl-CoA dehydrogenase family protein [Marivirga atlantica]MBL0765306.1 acyl-CoA dehydrogenase family protein [Marivirga atlantica]